MQLLFFSFFVCRLPCSIFRRSKLLSHPLSGLLSLPLNLNADHRPLPLPPPHTQLELKEYLTKVYGFDIATLRTSVLAGKKKRGKAGNSYARPDIKKVYVSLRPPSQASQ